MFQVIDLSKDAPGEMLCQLFLNLEKLTLAGDLLASEIKRNLKIIVSLFDQSNLFTMYWLFNC